MTRTLTHTHLTTQRTPKNKWQVIAELLSELVEQPFYDELRTQQQLGYLVFSGAWTFEGGGVVVCWFLGVGSLTCVRRLPFPVLARVWGEVSLRRLFIRAHSIRLDKPGLRVTERVPSLVFIVQSTVADPQVRISSQDSDAGLGKHLLLLCGMSRNRDTNTQTSNK